jgi:glycosyltransferase involved in cell wall biosynthesis
LKIGIDATVLAQRETVGISRFVSNLVENLAAIDRESEYYLCYRPRALKSAHRIWKPRDPRFHVRILQEPFNRRLFRELDVFHSTYQRLPAYRDLAPYLGTLHDIFHMSQPEMASAETSARWAARYRDVAERSELVMTLSEFSKHEITRLLGVDPERVRVVPLAASANYAPVSPEQSSATRRRYGLERPFVLFAGGGGGRKNLVGAVEAFALALPDLGPDVCLAVSGSGGSAHAVALERARNARIEERVVFLGFVPESDFPSLMSASHVFFFPSLLEGFGLPALEAMACGAVVVASSTTSLPEVCADAAILADPSSARALADALIRAATNERLREDLRRRATLRAKEFSWRRVAEQTLALYREIG